MSFIQANQNGGGFKPFIEITGTPTQVAYFDLSGNGTGDSNFTRDPNDNYFTKLLADTQAFLVIYKGNGSSYQAVNHGAIGNTITLVFNGTDDIDTVVAAWNAANPSNQVALISGLGTEVLSANTYNLSGGGVTGLQVGHHDIFGAQTLDGTATYALDQTSGAFAGSLFGDASALGIPGLSGVFGYIDFAGNNFAAIIANPEELSLNYGSPAGHASLQLDSKEASISSGNKWGFQMSDNNSEIGWFTPSYTLKLPTTTPNVGDSIQVTSSGGGNYYTSWATGGGGAAGSNKWVQFNNAGVLGASQDFTWNDNSKTFNVGGGSNPNLSELSVNRNFVYTGFSIGAGQYFGVQDKASGYDVLSIQADIFSGEFGSINGFAPNANSVYFGVNNPGKNLTAYGLSKNSLDSFVHTGGGLNDVTLTATPFYTGNNGTGSFTATITHNDTQRIDMTPGGFTPPLPGLGDVVTDGTVSGTVYQTDGVSSFFVEGVTGGVFGSGVAITGPGGFAGTIQSIDYGFLTDRFTISYLGGTAVADNVPTLATPTNFYFGIAPEFPSVTGYTIGDSWDYSYSVSYGSMLNMDGGTTNATVTIGDVNGLYGSGGNTAISMNILSGYTQYGGGHANKTDYVGTASYNIKQSDYNVDVRINLIGAAPDLYLPDVGIAGREYVITDEDGNSALYPITIHAASGQTFNTTGTSTLVINTNFKSVRIHGNSGANGWVVTSN